MSLLTTDDPDANTSYSPSNFFLDLFLEPSLLILRTEKLPFGIQGDRYPDVGRLGIPVLGRYCVSCWPPV